MTQLGLSRTFLKTFTGRFNKKKITIRKIFNKGRPSYKVLMKYKLNKNLFYISQETVISKIKKTIGSEDLLTGDKNFDSKMLLRANNPGFFLALLDHYLRKMILNIERYSDSLEIRNSETVVFISESNTHRIKYIIKQIDQMSTRLEIMQGIKLKNLVLDKIRTDTDAGVRAFSIRMIKTELNNNDNEVRTTLKNALNDESFDVQLEAAMCLDEAGANHFIKRLQSGKKIPPEQLIKIIDFFAHRQYSAALPVLSKLLEKTENVKIQIKILKLFSLHGNTGINDQLVSMLKLEEPELLIHLINALERCGNLDAVEVLYKIGLNTKNFHIKQSVEKTIAGIQAREGKGEKGWLSVSRSAEKEGRLSIADSTPEGSLSIKEGDEI
jgi:hypothetical protein